MRISACVILCALFLLPCRAPAQPSPDSADHDALRKLKDDVLAAVNARDMNSITPILHKPFVATLLTQDKFDSAAAMQAWFDGLFNRPVLRLSKLTMKAEADELSQIHTGTFSVTHGTTSELYEMGDGRRFDMKGRWTAVCLKENGLWKLLALHTGTNFLDNPVINAIEAKLVTAGVTGLIGGAVAGALAGLLLGAFLWRKKSPAAAQGAP